jgi:hypothetical protein
MIVRKLWSYIIFTLSSWILNWPIWQMLRETLYRMQIASFSEVIPLPTGTEFYVKQQPA